MNPAQNLDQLEDYLGADPRNAALLSDVVHSAVQAGLTARARTALDRADPFFAGTSTLRHLEAVVLLSERRYAEACAVLQDVAASCIDQPGVTFNLGYALLRSGDAAAAVDVLRPLAQRDDAPAATLAYLMRSLHHCGDAAGAIEAWESAAERLRTPEALAVAGLVHLDLEHIDTARAMSDTALAAGSRAVEALVTRGTIAVADDDMARADELLGVANAQLPNDGRIFSAIGVARLARGDLGAAEEAFARSVALLPQHLGTWHALAWSQFLAGRLDAAGQSFATALVLDRNFGESYGGVAVIEAMQGRADTARENIERARRLDPQGLAFRYAEAVLAGAASNPDAIRTLALRLLRQRDVATGVRLVDRIGR